MEGRRIPTPVRVMLIAVLSVVVLIAASGVVWWKAMSDLSWRSSVEFARELERAAADSVFSRADLELMEELRAISASKKSSLLGRSLCLGVAGTPLLRGSVFPEDRVDMEAVRDVLAPRHGNLSLREANLLWGANPRLQETLRNLRPLGRESVTKGAFPESRAGAPR